MPHLNIGNLRDLERRALQTRSTARAVAPRLDFSHLAPAPSVVAATSSSATSTTFAERMLAADAATRGETFDRANLAAAPSQRRTVATASEIMAAHRAAHPSHYEDR